MSAISNFNSGSSAINGGGDYSMIIVSPRDKRRFSLMNDRSVEGVQ